MADNDTVSGLSGLGQAPIKITPGTKPGALPSVALTSGASIDPTTSSAILSQMENMIAERQSPFQKFRQDIDTALAHTGYMPTERIKADAEMRQAREAELANLVMNKASLESGLKQGEAIRSYLNTPQGGGVSGVGTSGTAGMSPITQMIASLPAAEQGYARLLAATDPNMLFKIVHENMLKRPDIQKGFEYAQTLPPDQREVYLGQLFEKGYAPRSYINEKGETVQWSPAASKPGGAPAPSTGKTTAADWAVDNGFQVISGTRTPAESAALVHHYDENGVPRTKEGRPIDLKTSAHFTGDAFDVKPGTVTPELEARAAAAGYKRGTGIEANHFSRAPATSAPISGKQEPVSQEAVKQRQDALTSSSKFFYDNDYKVITERAETAKEVERLADQVLDNIKGNDFGPGSKLNQDLMKYAQLVGIKLDPNESEKYIRNLNIETARKFLSAQSARQAMGAQFTAQESSDWLNAFAGIDNPKEYLKNFYQLQKAGALVDQDLKNFLMRNKGNEQEAYVKWQDSGAKDRIMQENVDAFKKGKPSAQKPAEATPAETPKKKKTVSFNDLQKG